VVLFKDGQPVDGFAGAQPESAVRALLEPHVQMPPPAAADPFEQAQALFDDGRYADAEAALVVMLTEDNTNAKALILYARCLTERGELDEAQTVLDAVKSDEHKAALAGAKAQIKFLGLARDLPDAADLKARLAKDPQDDEAVYQLAIQQLARQQYEAALDALLKLFIRNRNYGEGLPHKTLLQVFELLGNDHPLVTVYRRKMFAAIFCNSLDPAVERCIPAAHHFHVRAMAQTHQQALARCRAAGQPFQLIEQIRPAQLPGLAQQVLGDLPQGIVLIQRFRRRG